MTGNATQVHVLSATDLGLVSASWSVAQTGDFNGDGKTDILWHNTNGDTSIWLMTASGTQMQVLAATDLGVVPQSWNIAGAGDFNGDGRSDILWRNTNGDTSIWLMTGNGPQVQVVVDGRPRTGPGELGRRRHRRLQRRRDERHPVAQLQRRHLDLVHERHPGVVGLRPWRGTAQLGCSGGGS